MKKLSLALLITASGVYFSACTNDSDSIAILSDESVDVSLTSEEATVLSVSREGTSISQDEALQKAGMMLNGKMTRAELTDDDCQIYWVKYHSTLPRMYSSDTKPDSIPLYVINRNNGGFALISGDERLPEVLAYSEDGELSLEKKGTGIDEVIDRLPYFVSATIDEFEAKYDSLLIVAQEKAGLRGGPQIGEHFQRLEMEYTDWKVPYSYAPLTNVKWGQSYPYNQKLDKIACGIPLLGCTTVAIAQILSVYKYPVVFDGTSVDWVGMTKSPYGYSLSSTNLLQLQLMMKSIANDVVIEFGCSGTSSNINEANNYFTNNGYTTDGFVNYNKNEIITSLSNSRPLYTRASSHAWVIDGANAKSRHRIERIYEFLGTGTPSNPTKPSEWRLVRETTSEEKYEYVYCNFGWDGTDNGYYSHGIFNTSNGTLKDNLMIIPNIKRK